MNSMSHQLLEKQSFSLSFKISEFRRNHGSCIRNLMLAAIGGSLYYGYILYMFFHHPYKEYSIREKLWISSAGFVCLTIPVSIRLIYLHLTHWVQPRVQKYVVRIIWMIPVYSIESWLALRYGSYTFFIETLRECYEAYVIYNFLYFLISLLGEEAHLVALLKDKPAQRGVHKWPTNMFVSSWIMGYDFLYKCKHGVFQYIILKNVTAVLTFVLAAYHLYGDGSWRVDRGYMYIFIVNSFSQLWALYCMILFYTATREELGPWKPVAKFLCVKMVVFATWWQAVALDVILYGSDANNSHLSKAIQNFAICIEMLAASIGFSYAFSHNDFVNVNSSGQLAKTKIDDPVSEIQDDMRHPVLSALQSSLNLPDDLFADIRRATRNATHYMFFDDAVPFSHANCVNSVPETGSPVPCNDAEAVQAPSPLHGSGVAGLSLPTTIDIDIDLEANLASSNSSNAHHSHAPLSFDHSGNKSLLSSGPSVLSNSVKAQVRPTGFRRLAQILSFGSFQGDSLDNFSAHDSRNTESNDGEDSVPLLSEKEIGVAKNTDNLLSDVPPALPEGMDKKDDEEATDTKNKIADVSIQ